MTFSYHFPPLRGKGFVRIVSRCLVLRLKLAALYFQAKDLPCLYYLPDKPWRVNFSKQ